MIKWLSQSFLILTQNYYEYQNGLQLFINVGEFLSILFVSKETNEKPSEIAFKCVFNSSALFYIMKCKKIIHIQLFNFKMENETFANFTRIEHNLLTKKICYYEIHIILYLSKYHIRDISSAK